jgi:hypothetical protein
MNTVTVASSSVIQIDRSTPFDPIAFLGEDYSIVEQDERSLTLLDIDLSRIHFSAMLVAVEVYLDAEEKLRRLKKAGHVRLDAKIFQTLWENKHLIPEAWEGMFNTSFGEITFKHSLITFDGTILKDLYGDRYVMYLHNQGREWSWCIMSLDEDLTDEHLSALFV